MVERVSSSSEVSVISPSIRPIASFAKTTVLRLLRTMVGTGRYCIAENASWPGDMLGIVKRKGLCVGERDASPKSLRKRPPVNGRGVAS